MANTCFLFVRFCVETAAKWMWENKLTTFFGLLSFSLLISTLVLASQRNSARQDLSDLRESLNPTTTEDESATDSTTEDPSLTTGPPDTTKTPGEEADTNPGPANMKLMKLMGYAAS